MGMIVCVCFAGPQGQQACICGRNESCQGQVQGRSCYHQGDPPPPFVPNSSRIRHIFVSSLVIEDLRQDSINHACHCPLACGFIRKARRAQSRARRRRTQRLMGPPHQAQCKLHTNNASGVPLHPLGCHYTLHSPDLCRSADFSRLTLMTRLPLAMLRRRHMSWMRRRMPAATLDEQLLGPCHLD